MHPLLSPHYEGTDDGLMRILPDWRAAACGSEGPERSHSRISEDTQRTGFETADGNGRKGLLQRSGWIGAVVELVSGNRCYL